jgi:hypothetical protein
MFCGVFFCVPVSDTELDDSGKYEVEVSNESGAATAVFNLKVASQYSFSSILLFITVMSIIDKHCLGTFLQTLMLTRPVCKL